MSEHTMKEVFPEHISILETLQGKGTLGAAEIHSAMYNPNEISMRTVSTYCTQISRNTGWLKKQVHPQVSENGCVLIKKHMRYTITEEGREFLLEERRNRTVMPRTVVNSVFALGNL